MNVDGENKNGAMQSPSWYAVQVYWGSENSIVEEIKSLARLKNISEYFSDFYFPPKNPEEVVAQESPKNRVATLYPGYLFVKMVMTNESWDLVTKISKVVSFVGPNKLSPRPLTDQEYQKMVDDVAEMAQKKEQKLVISVGDMVKIREGSFQSLMGKVVEVDAEKNRIGITLKIFDRETTLDLDWSQVDKVNQA